MIGVRFGIRRASDGSLTLAVRHPAHCLTWHWYVGLKRNAVHCNVWRLVHRAERRTHQWHDYYRLPFGWWLIVGRQDYHKREPIQ